MLVQCPECSTKYNLNEDQVAPQGSKVRCIRCKTVFTVFRPEVQDKSTEPIVPEPAPTVSDTPDQAGTKDSTAQETFLPPTDFEDDWDSWGSEKDPAPSSSSFEDELDAIFSGKKETSPADSGSQAKPAFSSFDDDLDELFAPTPAKPKEPVPTPKAQAPDAFEDELEDLLAPKKESKPTPAKDDLAADLEGAFQQPLLDSSITTDQSTPASSPEKSNRFGLITAVLLLLIVLLGAGIYFKFIGLPVTDPRPTGGNTTAETNDAPVSAAQIALENVRQYFVPNEKEGQLFIIEGKAVNRFSEPKEMLRLKATLFDKQGEAVTSQEFMCGNVVTLYQLQVSSRQDIEAALGAKVGILTNNTNIQPGAAVPFMTVFFDTPETVEEFGLEVIQSQSPQ